MRMTCPSYSVLSSTYLGDCRTRVPFGFSSALFLTKAKLGALSHDLAQSSTHTARAQGPRLRSGVADRCDGGQRPHPASPVLLVALLPTLGALLALAAEHKARNSPRSQLSATRHTIFLDL